MTAGLTAAGHREQAGNLLADAGQVSRIEARAAREMAALVHAVLAVSAPDAGERRAVVVAGALAEVQAELGRADGKAGTLLALATGALAALLVFAQGGRAAGVAAWLLWAAAGLAGCAVALLLAVVRPRLAGCGGDGFAGHRDRLAATDPAGYLGAAEAELAVLSGLAVAKYRRLRLAVNVLLCTLSVLAAAAVIAAGGGR